MSRIITREDKRKFLAKVIFDWVNYLDNDTIDALHESFLKILASYPKKDIKGYNTNDKNIIYPKMVDLKKSFLLSEPSEIKAIILGVEPFNNGEATGIPFELKTQYPAKFKLSDTQQNTDSIDECIALNIKYDPFFPAVDWEGLLQQGVLLLNVSWTSLEAKELAHYNVWKNATTLFINSILSKFPDTVILTIGEYAKIPLEGKYIINAPDSYFFPNEKRLKFRRFNAFNKLNNQLSELDKDIINYC